jgi:hypothetical protein
VLRSIGSMSHWPQVYLPFYWEHERCLLDGVWKVVEGYLMGSFPPPILLSANEAEIVETRAQIWSHDNRGPTRATFSPTTLTLEPLTS